MGDFYSFCVFHMNFSIVDCFLSFVKGWFQPPTIWDQLFLTTVSVLSLYSCLLLLFSLLPLQLPPPDILHVLSLHLFHAPFLPVARAASCSCSPYSTFTAASCSCSFYSTFTAASCSCSPYIIITASSCSCSSIFLLQLPPALVFPIFLWQLLPSALVLPIFLLQLPPSCSWSPHITITAASCSCSPHITITAASCSCSPYILISAASFSVLPTLPLSCILLLFSLYYYYS